jgi:hypothetical protein
MLWALLLIVMIVVSKQAAHWDKHMLTCRDNTHCTVHDYVAIVHISSVMAY